jgi:hypothetical protein
MQNFEKPKSCAFAIKTVPIVSHHSIKPALTAEVQMPANKESRFKLGVELFWRLRFLNALIPIKIMKAPPIMPIVD